MPPDTEDLPEPAQLHARFSNHHPVDWGPVLPTTAQLTAEFGPHATRAALSLLDELGSKVERATEDMLAATPEVALYQLDHRIKSPQSLARKLTTRLDSTRRQPEVEDLLRYTVLTSEGQFVPHAKQVTKELKDRDWRVQGVRNSYVEGSRYKGLHLDLRDPGGQRIELQVHTPASIAVKEATTSLYEIERDRRRPRKERQVARDECIRLSAQLKAPPGLAALKNLGGCEVRVDGYGVGPKRGTARRPAAAEENRSRQPGSGRQAVNDGMER